MKTQAPHSLPGGWTHLSRGLLPLWPSGRRVLGRGPRLHSGSRLHSEAWLPNLAARFQEQLRSGSESLTFQMLPGAPLTFLTALGPSPTCHSWTDGSLTLSIRITCGLIKAQTSAFPRVPSHTAAVGPGNQAEVPRRDPPMTHQQPSRASQKGDRV